MRKISIVFVAVVALAGCQHFDSIIRQNLDAACAVIDAGNESFEALKASITIEQRYIDTFDAAYRPAHDICLHPETATTMVVVTRVITAGAAIYRILTQVTQNNPAAMEAIQ